MPSCIIHYFSGTGNTHHAMSVAAKYLTEAGYTVQLHSIDGGELPQGPTSDLHLVAFPVYACAVPSVMLRYLRRLPLGHGAKVAVIAIYGEVNSRHTIPGYEGQAPVQAAKYLRRRGYDVFYTGAVGYPANLSQAGLVPTMDDQVKLIAAADELIVRSVHAITKGERRLKSYNPIVLVCTWIFGMMFSLVGHRVGGKCYVATSDCSGCGLCAAACPVGAIQMHEGRPRWGWTCESCQRCMGVCPQRAIQTSVWRFALLLGVAFLPLPKPIRPLGSKITGGLPILRSLLSWVLAIGCYLGAVFITDLALHQLERLPGLKYIFRQGLNARSRRYLAPGFPPKQPS